MTWSASDVIALRGAFGMDQTLFARLLSVHPRSVIHWETGQTVPEGAQQAIMTAFREAFAERPDDIPYIIAYARTAAEVGGLSYLFLKLLGDALFERKLGRTIPSLDRGKTP